MYCESSTLRIFENLVAKCEICNKHADSNIKEPLKSHSILKSPWQKIGIDLYELEGETYLICIDYYSKYPEISNLCKNLTAENIINKLKSIFARHGIPKIVVSDSGPQFISAEFQKFSNDWDFKSIAVSPHHQQSNGLAERNIQTVKKMIKKCHETKEDIYLALLSFRNTPILNNTYSPSQILMSRYLRDNLPSNDKKLMPNVVNKFKLEQQINQSQKISENSYNKNVRFRDELDENEIVWYQFKPKGVWYKGKIVEKVRDRTYKILRENGKCIIRNKFYVRPSKCNTFNVQPASSSYVATHIFDQSNNIVENNKVSTSREHVSNLNHFNVNVESTNQPSSSHKRIINKPSALKDYILY